MKTCRMCQTDKEDVVMVAVAPATWNGFNNFAEVCGTCRESRRFKTWSRTGSSRTKPAVVAAPAETDGAPAAPIGKQTLISHRQTGALLFKHDGGSLAGADLSSQNLASADLRNGELRGANLSQCDLHLADLHGADLRGTDLRAVNFRGADLRGADLREARMHRADLRHSLYDEQTLWPAGFDPHGTGAIKGDRRN
jgi:hypothetical protein